MRKRLSALYEFWSAMEHYHNKKHVSSPQMRPPSPENKRALDRKTFLSGINGNETTLSRPNSAYETNYVHRTPSSASTFASTKSIGGNSTSRLLSASSTSNTAFSNITTSSRSNKVFTREDAAIRQISRPADASKLLFRRLWQSPIRIPETIIFGEDGELMEWLFFSKHKNCILRKKYETTNVDDLQESWLHEDHVRHLHRDEQGNAPLGHMEAQGGRAVILRDTFERMLLDARKQQKRKTEIINGASLGRSDLMKKREKFMLGPCIIKRYTQPAANTVMTCKYTRTLRKPRNPVEARRMGNKSESIDYGQISHNAAYDDIEGSAAEIRALTMAKTPKIVPAKQTHYVPDAQRSALEDFVKFGVYCRHKQVQSSSRISSRLDQVVNEILHWLERRHGMLVIAMDLEFMIPANKKDMGSLKGPILVTSCTKISWVQAAPLWEVPVGYNNEGSPTRRPKNWAMEVTTAPTVPLVHLGHRAHGLSDDEDEEMTIEVVQDPYTRRSLTTNYLGLPHHYITGLKKTRSIPKTGAELVLTEQIEAMALNSKQAYEKTQHMHDVAKQNFKQSAMLKKRCREAEQKCRKMEANREHDMEKVETRIQSEVNRRKSAEFEIGKLQRSLSDMAEKMKILKKRLDHYEGQCKVLDDLHLSAEANKEKEMAAQKRKDDAMDMLVAVIGFRAKSKHKKQSKKGGGKSKPVQAKTTADSSKPSNSFFTKKEVKVEEEEPQGVEHNPEAMKKLDALKKNLASPNPQGYFGATLGGFLDVFAAIDVEDHGEISTAEFHEAMRLLGLKRLDEVHIHSLGDAIDSDKSGTIEYSEFVNALLERMQHARKQGQEHSRTQPGSYGANVSMRR